MIVLTKQYNVHNNASKSKHNVKMNNPEKWPSWGTAAVGNAEAKDEGDEGEGPCRTTPWVAASTLLGCGWGAVFPG